MAVSQKDIAEEIGIDRSLVAHALRGDPRVAETTRRKVEEAAQRLGYHASSNREARALVARRYGKKLQSGIIAVLLPPRFHGQPHRQVPFFMPLLDGIEIEAQERDLDVLLTAWHGGRLPRLIAAGDVDGVICPFTTYDATLLRDSEVPVIHVINGGPGTCDLLPDHSAGAYQATRHLLELGHRRIAYISMPLNNASHRQRLKGYQQALQEAGLLASAARVIEVEEPTIEAGRAGMARLLAEGCDFTGLICFNDLIAMGTIEQAQTAGLDVPGQLSVVGFDDVSDDYNFQPALSSVRFDRLAMGRRAVQLICETVEFRKIASRPRRKRAEVFPVKLIVRHSSSPYAKQK